ncbi:succinate dehydrogenase/fumarate reductase cytochrome b subunit [Desulfovibrio aminophilus]|nr:succinate dehydrogenase/fumarate reductase cytochrome b subunit [Desulfovibrio aminophilus]MCM0756427.1 succinate dehydrogenase/fumarate reductase cytochrome b subunit [Desulfovibrio aminophilus]
MGIDTTVFAGRPTKWDGLLDWLQMLSGAALILFIWAHMLLVASVIIGPGVMNAIADFFEATGLAQVGGPLIFLLFLGHFLLAARKVPFRFDRQKTFWSHATMLHHQDTWLWLVQVVTAMLLLLMGTIHMWVVLTDLPITAAKSAEVLQKRSGWLLFYLLFGPLVHVHLGVGLYRIGVKWGFVGQAGRARFKRFVTILVLVCVGLSLLTLLRFSFLAI